MESLYNPKQSQIQDTVVEETKEKQESDVEGDLPFDRLRMESPSIGIMGNLDECGMSMIMHESNVDEAANQVVINKL